MTQYFVLRFFFSPRSTAHWQWNPWLADLRRRAA